MDQGSRVDFLCALLVGAEPEGRLVMLDVFRRTGWRLRQARDRKGALACLDRHAVQVAVVNAHVPSWPWKQALKDLRRMPHPPQLVVTSRLADESLWAEVLNFGAYDVLAEPFDGNEIERVMASARRHFEPQLMRVARAQAAAAS